MRSCTCALHDAQTGRAFGIDGTRRASSIASRGYQIVVPSGLTVARCILSQSRIAECVVGCSHSCCSSCRSSWSGARRLRIARTKPVSRQRSTSATMNTSIRPMARSPRPPKMLTTLRAHITRTAKAAIWAVPRSCLRQPPLSALCPMATPWGSQNLVTTPTFRPAPCARIEPIPPLPRDPAATW